MEHPHHFMRDASDCFANYRRRYCIHTAPADIESCATAAIDGPSQRFHSVATLMVAPSALISFLLALWVDESSLFEVGDLGFHGAHSVILSAVAILSLVNW
eukprot:scaffold261289_cov28-Tisochrysis_lutea.AAC.1